VVPAHKAVLVAALKDGAAFDLSFVLGKEDGTIVGKVTQGLGVPTPLPKDVMYVAIFANPFTEGVDQYVTLANSVAAAGGRVNVVFSKTQPKVMDKVPAQLMDLAVAKTKLTKDNLRLFTLLGDAQLPNRIWPRKQAPSATAAAPAAAPGAPAAPKR